MSLKMALAGERTTVCRDNFFRTRAVLSDVGFKFGIPPAQQ